MNKFLPYLKKYGALAGVALLALVGIPASYVFATSALAEVKSEQQKKVDDAGKDLSSARVTYKLEPISPGAPAKEFAAVPNAKLTGQVKTLREAMATASRKVFGEAVIFNMGPRTGATPAEAAAATLLVPDLLPDPGQKSQVLRLAMARLYAGPAHERLLTKYRAGPVMDAVVLAQELELRQQEIIRDTLSPGQELSSLTEDQQRGIRDNMLGSRIRRYREHAGSVAFYASIDSLANVSSALAESEPSLRQCWDWQTQYWIREDIFRAIALANQSATSAIDAPVKRLLWLAIDQAAASAGSGSPAPNPGDAGAAPAGDPNAVPPSNLRLSPSGRISGPGSGNGMYDLRSCNVIAIVAAKRLPQWLDAIARTNFMTVLDCDVDAVDSVEQLKDGYYYGAEPVVKVSVRIETAWLREWTKKYMPSEIRAELEIAPDAPPEGTAPADGSTPPPPAGG